MSDLGGSALVLLYKPDNTPYGVYDITYDSDGYPMFLIYRRGEWIRKSAKYFTPDFYEDGMGGYVEFKGY